MNVKLPTEALNCLNFIDGVFSKGNGQEYYINSPYNGKRIGIANASTVDDVNKAIATAQVAQKAWGETPIKERTKIMFNFRNILIRDLDEMAHLKSC
jgi:malonate-semialdehyde dehydrogenase (acetylating)/methylmalonate-semialdehyde dehydrogenase